MHAVRVGALMQVVDGPEFSPVSEMHCLLEAGEIRPAEDNFEAGDKASLSAEVMLEGPDLCSVAAAAPPPSTDARARDAEAAAKISEWI